VHHREAKPSLTLDDLIFHQIGFIWSQTKVHGREMRETNTAVEKYAFISLDAKTEHQRLFTVSKETI
jgi:hypothetical protein